MAPPSDQPSVTPAARRPRSLPGTRRHPVLARGCSCRWLRPRLPIPALMFTAGDAGRRVAHDPAAASAGAPISSQGSRPRGTPGVTGTSARSCQSAPGHPPRHERRRNESGRQAPPSSKRARRPGRFKRWPAMCPLGRVALDGVAPGRVRAEAVTRRQCGRQVTALPGCVRPHRASDVEFHDPEGSGAQERSGASQITVGFVVCVRSAEPGCLRRYQRFPRCCRSAWQGLGVCIPPAPARPIGRERGARPAPDSGQG